MYIHSQHLYINMSGLDDNQQKFSSTVISFGIWMSFVYCLIYASPAINDTDGLFDYPVMWTHALVQLLIPLAYVLLLGGFGLMEYLILQTVLLSGNLLYLLIWVTGDQRKIAAQQHAALWDFYYVSMIILSTFIGLSFLFLGIQKCVRKYHLSLEYNYQEIL